MANRNHPIILYLQDQITWNYALFMYRWVTDLYVYVFDIFCTQLLKYCFINKYSFLFVTDIMNMETGYMNIISAFHIASLMCIMKNQHKDNWLAPCTVKLSGWKYKTETMNTSHIAALFPTNSHYDFEDFSTSGYNVTDFNFSDYGYANDTLIGKIKHLLYVYTLSKN